MHSSAMVSSMMMCVLKSIVSNEISANLRMQRGQGHMKCQGWFIFKRSVIFPINEMFKNSQVSGRVFTGGIFPRDIITVR
jgi:hypothetical protein